MFTETNGITTIAYYARDPSRRLAGYELLDKSGKPLRTEGGAQLVLYVATDEASRKVPFRVENIRLP